jgi:hypothetical protein
MSLTKPIVIFANAGVLRGHLPKTWNLIAADLPMAPFAEASIDHRGYYPVGWSTAEASEAIGELKTDVGGAPSASNVSDLQ